MTALLPLLVAVAGQADVTALDADQAVRRALAHAPVLEAQRALLVREEARARRIKIDPLRVRFDHRAAEQVFGRRVDGDGVPYGPFDRTYWSVGARPPALSQLGVDQSVDAHRAAALSFELDSEQRALAAEVRALHAAALLRGEEAQLLGEAIALGGRMRDAVEQKLAAQAATALDAGAAELELLDLELELEDVLAQKRRAEARLGRLTAASGPVAAVGELPPCEEPWDAARVVPVARERSPRLRALHEREQALDAEGVANNLRFVPWFNEVTLGYLNQPTDQRDQLRAIVEVDVPVFALFDGKGRDLELRRARVDAERREAESEIADDVAAAVERLRAAAGLVARHRAATEDIAARSTAAVDAALSSGNVDVIAASQVYVRALKSRRAQLRARERCVEATIELMRVTGDVVPAPAASE